MNKIRDSIIKGNTKLALKLMEKSEENILNVDYGNEAIPTLHLAAEFDKSGEIIEYLVKNGADVERHRYQPLDVDYDDYIPLYNKRDCSALTWAIINKNREAVEKLLDLDADPNGRNDTLDKPITTAVFLEEDDEAEYFTITLGTWNGDYIISELKCIAENKFSNLKYYKQEMDYSDGYFCSNDQKSKKLKFIKFIKEVLEETKKIIESQQNTEKSEESLPSEDDLIDE